MYSQTCENWHVMGRLEQLVYTKSRITQYYNMDVIQVLDGLYVMYIIPERKSVITCKSL